MFHKCEHKTIELENIWLKNFHKRLDLKVKHSGLEKLASFNISAMFWSNQKQ